MMKHKRRMMLATAVGAMLVSTIPAWGDPAAPAAGQDDLQAELRSLRARVAELEAKESDTWLNERRAEELKTLIREVLADADTRASLLGDDFTAGHDGNRFFLASVDDTFLMKISGQLQFRFVSNWRTGTDDNHDSGFEVPRAKLAFNGHVGDPRIKYKMKLSVDRSTNEVKLDEMKISHELENGVVIWAGESKAPFLREEGVSSKYQLAVDRSLVNEVFTVDYVQGVGAKWLADDSAKLYLTLHDGVRSGRSGAPNTKAFDGDDTEIAVTARIDLRLAGEWSQAKDFSAWNGEGTALFAGAAIDWELLESDDDDSFVIWTLDGGYEEMGMAIYAAIMGLSTDIEASDDRDALGFLAQFAYMLVPDKVEPFVRWEYMDLDDEDLDDDKISLITAGANWYVNGHRAKFTLDVVWALDPIPSLDALGVSTGGLGLKPDAADEDNQVTVRAQGQVLF